MQKAGFFASVSTFHARIPINFIWIRFVGTRLQPFHHQGGRTRWYAPHSDFRGNWNPNISKRLGNSFKVDAF
jgi:hypothetical protein